MKDSDFENIKRIIGCWCTVQVTADDSLTRKIIADAFKANLSDLNLDSISRNLIKDIFSMDYNELVDHINSLVLDEDYKIQILSQLENVKWELLSR
jgi:hypothetical protein